MYDRTKEYNKPLESTKPIDVSEIKSMPKLFLTLANAGVRRDMRPSAMMRSMVLMTKLCKNQAMQDATRAVICTVIHEYFAGHDDVRLLYAIIGNATSDANSDDRFDGIMLCTLMLVDYGLITSINKKTSKFKMAKIAKTWFDNAVVHKEAENTLPDNLSEEQYNEVLEKCPKRHAYSAMSLIFKDLYGVPDLPPLEQHQLELVGGE